MSESLDQIASRPTRGRQSGKTSHVRPRAHREATADISKLVGGNVRQARKRLGYSLDVLARTSGVSRAMLGQIETAKSVPTVTVLWRIADALGVTVSDLIARPAPDDIVVVRADETVGACVWVEGADYRVISSPQTRELQTVLELRLGAERAAQLLPPPGATSATLIVARGEVYLEAENGPRQYLGERDAAIVNWRTAATVTNTGKAEAVLYFVLAPQRSAF